MACPSPAVIIALIVLGVAFSENDYAVAQLATNAWRTTQITNGGIT